MKKGRLSERAMRVVFTAAACVCILAVALICLFLLLQGIPAIGEIGVGRFLFGMTWKPLENKFGILPMIVGSLYVTVGAALIGVPVGVLCAVFLARFCPERLHRRFKPVVELLAGVPSIVYGFFGLTVLVPLCRSLFGGSGKGVLTASVLLGMMILPTVITVAESALRAVPETYYEGALALGATPERAVFTTELPAARSGVTAGIILGVGRAIGETMAVVMVAGNQPIMPDSVLSGVRTLTANIVTEMGYAADLHRGALFGTAVVLLAFVLLINLCFRLLKREART
jgi:phosphate transport system permease protein